MLTVVLLLPELPELFIGSPLLLVMCGALHERRQVGLAVPADVLCSAEVVVESSRVFTTAKIEHR